MEQTHFIFAAAEDNVFLKERPTLCFYYEISPSLSHFTTPSFLTRETHLCETYSVKEIIHSFQSAVRQCLTVIEF